MESASTLLAKETLEQICNKPPMSLTDEELAALVSHYRAEMKKWTETGRAPTKKKSGTSAKSVSSTKKSEAKNQLLNEL